MDIHYKPTLNKTTKSEIEQVVKDKKEDKLVGTFLRRKGLTLFGYSPKDNTLYIVEIAKTQNGEITITNKGLSVIDQADEKAQVITSDIYFEALNQKSAEKRLSKYKAGKLSDLSNLRPFVEPKSIINF